MNIRQCLTDFTAIGSIFPYNADIDFKYHAPYITEINKWCVEQFGEEYDNDRWMWDVSPVPQCRRFHFKNEKDLAWFLLRWSQ
jgi:hypothetical protein